jgi:ribosomal protein S18 acetylase RimI-like enzyme
MADESWSSYAKAGLDDPEKRIYVAERGPQIVGFVKLFFEEKSWGRACEVETLVVDEGARDQGIGHDLMRRAEEVARHEGALAMRVNVLSVNAEGRRFYERSDYRTIAVRYGKPL